jgi:phage terminase large subunit
LQISGFNVIPCVKGPGSILQGLDLMKQRKIFIHRKSSNLQLEFEHYRWKKSVSGDFKREPEDKWNHAIDAVRYWAMAELQQDKWSNAHGGKKINVKSAIRSRRR